MTTEVSVVVEQVRRRLSGGIGSYARGLVLGLGQLGPHSGVEVELIASRPNERPDPLAHHGFPTRASRLPGPLLTRLWDRGWPWPRPRAVMQATSFAYPPPSGRLVVTVHDLAFREVADAFPDRGRRWHEQRLAHALGRASSLVVPAARTADALVAAGADPHKVVVIAEGADHLPAPAEPEARWLLDSLGVGDRFLLTVGTLEPRKNLGRLFDAYERAGLAAGGCPLVVVGARGWGEQPDDVPAGVLLAGSPSDEVLAALYRWSELFVYVPLAEGFGLPPVEAMVAGAPVVASTEVPSVGDAAALVDPYDTAAMADLMRSLASSPERRAELAELGRAHASRLTWRACAEAHTEIWRSLG